MIAIAIVSLLISIISIMIAMAAIGGFNTNKERIETIILQGNAHFNDIAKRIDILERRNKISLIRGEDDLYN